MKKLGYVLVLGLLLFATYGYGYSHLAGRGMSGKMMGGLPMMGCGAGMMGGMSGPAGMIGGMMSEQMFQGCMNSMGMAQGINAVKIGMVLNFADKLDLSKAQTKKIRMLRSDFMKQNIELSAKIRIANLDKNEILSAEKIDEKALSAKIDELSDLAKQKELNAVKFEKAVKSVLTKDQLEKLEKINLGDDEDVKDKDKDNDRMPMMRR